MLEGLRPSEDFANSAAYHRTPIAIFTRHPMFLQAVGQSPRRLRAIRSVC